MPCDLITTEEAACESGIGKIESQTRLLKLIAQLSCEIADAGGGGGGGTPGGAPGDLQFNSAGVFGGFGDFNSGTGVLTIPGDLLFATDNADDIGALAATRPRTGFFGTSVVSPLFTGNLTGNVTGSSSLNVLKAGDTMTGTLTNLQTALGVTTANALLLANTTAAAAGAQQVSPALRWTGQGWKTNAVAASQAVDFRSYLLPVQGTASPTSRLVLESSINGAAFAELFSFKSNGQLTFGTSALGPSLQSNGPTLMVLEQALGIYNQNVGSFTFRCISTGGYGWNSGGDAAGAADTALFRNAAGIVEVNNGTAGTFRTMMAILKVSVNATAAAPPVTTHTIPITDASGQVYRVPCLV